jgi:heme-degrading monooxygenase HmoA
MILTVFRSRLNDGHRVEYDRHVELTAALAEKAPGFLGHKMFVAEDGERVTLVEFDSMESQRAWSLSAEHKAAAIAGRRGFYSEYQIQICTVERQSRFVPAQASASANLAISTNVLPKLVATEA